MTPAPRDPTAVTHEDSSDAELLAAHVEGDSDAFAVLVRRHQDRLWGVALRTLGDREEAADALQDALVKAFRRADTYGGQAAVTTWLHRIVVNACLDRVRRRRPTDPLPDDRRQLPQQASDPAERATTRLDVRAALETLPVEQRAALVLVDMQGYSVEEAAAILEVAPGTIKSRCARGRARLLPLLAPGRREVSSDAATVVGNQAGAGGVPPMQARTDEGGGTR
jgi:RNA polymerase sigma-70 factor (ECF subfamily)